jgi:hypothetical protein
MIPIIIQHPQRAAASARLRKVFTLALFNIPIILEWLRSMIAIALV